MIRFTPEQLQAITRLLPTPDFKLFLEGLAQYGEGELKHLVFCKQEKEVAQGRNQAIAILMEAIQKAPNDLSALKTKDT